MPQFSQKSIVELGTCHDDLQALMYEVVKDIDCTVLEGKRTEAQQVENVAKGVSKTLDSKHVYPLASPSLAVDIAPFPLRWPDRGSSTYMLDLARFYYFGGYVKSVAKRMGFKIRWGGDWDGDNMFIDQTFHDLPHFEIIT